VLPHNSLVQGEGPADRFSDGLHHPSQKRREKRSVKALSGYPSYDDFLRELGLGLSRTAPVPYAKFPGVRNRPTGSLAQALRQLLR